MNNSADSGHPCLISLDALSKSDKQPLFVTEEKMFVFNVLTQLMKSFLKSNFFSLFYHDIPVYIIECFFEVLKYYRAIYVKHVGIVDYILDLAYVASNNYIFYKPLLI